MLIDAKEFNKMMNGSKNDSVSMERLCNLCMRQIKLRLYTKYKDFRDYDDVLQEVMFRITQIPNKKYISSPQSWINTITDNYVCDHAKKFEPYLELLENFEYDFDITKHCENQEVIDALKNLDRLSYEILELKLFSGYTLKEISEMYDLSYVGIRSRLTRTRKALREIEITDETDAS